MRNFLIISVVALGLAGCSPLERQRTLADIGAYVGAPQHPDGSLSLDSAGHPIYDGVPDYDPVEVTAKVAEKAVGATANGGPYGLLAWALTGVGTVGLAWYKRKFLVDTAKALTGRAANFGEPIKGPAPSEDAGSAPVEK